MKKLVVTPVSNTIWWATVDEKRGLITGKKEDVTDDAIDAVFQHFIGMDGFQDKGFAGYEIPKKDSDDVVTICVLDNSRMVCMSKEKYEELLEKSSELSDIYN